MPPPKRALFSLNLDSDVDHIQQRVENHNIAANEKVKVLETKGPTREHTDLRFLSRPLEGVVNQAVDSVVEGTGGRIHTAEGDITYSHSETRRSNNVDGGRTINLKKKVKKGKSIEEQYDTSEL